MPEPVTSILLRERSPIERAAWLAERGFDLDWFDANMEIKPACMNAAVAHYRRLRTKTGEASE